MSNTICLTGHSGYIGSHFVKFLTALGHSPFLIGRKNVRISAIPKCTTSTLWNSTRELSKQLMDLDNPIIVNIAGLFASDHKTADFTQLVEANFGYSLSIMEAISDIPNAQLVNIGSSWEYDDFGRDDPQNLYAQLKACNSNVAKWYAANYDMKIINLKLNDTFGGNDQRTKLMPTLKRHYNAGSVAQLRYSEQLINLLHIDDVCEGLLTAAYTTSSLPSKTCETAFLYGNETLKLSELVKRINSLSSQKLKAHFQGKSPTEYQLRGVWDQSPSLNDWKPNMTLDTALEHYFIK